MKKLYFLFLFLLTTSLIYGKSELKRDKNFIYYITPLKEMAEEERVQALNQSKQMLLKQLEQVLPKNELSHKALMLVKEKDTDLQKVIEDTAEWLENKGTKVGIKPEDTIPSAFMIFIGGKILQDLKISGSFVVAFIVIPTKIKKIDIITREEHNYLTFQAGIVAIPVANVGIKIEPNGKAPFAFNRLGIGIIFGDLNKPSDFKGLFIAGSGTMPYLHGNYNLKIGLVKSSVKGMFQNAVVMVSSDKKAVIEWRLNAGGIIQCDKLLESIGLNVGDDIIKNTNRIKINLDEDKEITPIPTPSDKSEILNLETEKDNPKEE